MSETILFFWEHAMAMILNEILSLWEKWLVIKIKIEHFFVHDLFVLFVLIRWIKF